jgi:hypothetical protein
MVKIRNFINKLRNEALKNRAELIFDKMNGVIIYAPYQSEVTRLGGQIPDLRTAINNAKLGGTDRTAIKNKAQDEVKSLVNGLTKRFELDTKDMPEEEAKAFIEGAGMEVIDSKAKTAAPKKAITFLDVPANFTVTDKKKLGAALFGWDADEDAITNAIEIQGADGHWSVYAYSDAPLVILTGFPLGALQTFRMRGISTGTIVSDYTDPVTVWIS